MPSDRRQPGWAAGGDPGSRVARCASGSSFITDHQGAPAGPGGQGYPGVLVQGAGSPPWPRRLTWGIYRDRRPEMYGALLSLDGRSHPSGEGVHHMATRKIAHGTGLLLGLGPQAAEGAGEATEEKVLRLYNWSDYFAPDTLSRVHPGDQDPGHLRRDGRSETLEAKLMAGRSRYDLIFPGTR